MKNNTISISNLRKNLKSVLQIVEKGKTINIESHGKLIASIMPIEKKQKENRKKLLEIGKRSFIGDILSPFKDTWSPKL
jgi:prevent-host-death family protein